jgi:phenylalanine-4-hydroxylase
VAGQTDHALRGDYSNIRPDYTVDQDYSRYTAAEQDLWKRLYARQSTLVPRYACKEFIDILGALDFGAGIPHFDAINAKLLPATRWTLVAVPGLLPDEVFFTHLANRRFPVSVWLRNPEEFDYIVEPDIFHDFFGHVPLLFNSVFADYLEAYGKGGVKAKGLNALDYLARLYWYTVEFGLIRTPQGLRTYGAGILSSGGELPYCIESPKPHRIKFELMRVMQSQYKIDTFQETYFVIDSFKELFDATAPDFTPYYATLRSRRDLAANEVIAEDVAIAP